MEQKIQSYGEPAHAKGLSLSDFTNSGGFKDCGDIFC